MDASDAAAGRLHLVPKPAHVGLMLLGLLLFAVATTAILQTSAVASTSAMGGINVEPAARPWQYVGANPDGWWCPTASQCTTSNPTGRIDTEMALAQQLHVANIRVEIPWFLVEPSARGAGSCPSAPPARCSPWRRW